MQDELNNLVHSILQHGVQLKKRLIRGEALVLENEQAILKRMLMSNADAQRFADFGGDARLDARGMQVAAEAGAGRFLGIRYALACWLDELFLTDSPWDSRWNENKLELALYGSNDRAWRFWEQARVAETRSGNEALAAFYLCVMLGFRGEMREQADQLQAWVESCKNRVTRHAASAWSKPSELQAPTNVPPLRGRAGFRRMVVSGGTLLLILVPLLAFFLVFLFMQPRDLPFRAGKMPKSATPTKSVDGEIP